MISDGLDHTPEDYLGHPLLIPKEFPNSSKLAMFNQYGPPMRYQVKGGYRRYTPIPHYISTFEPIKQRLKLSS